MTPKSARDWIDLVLDGGWEPLLDDVVSENPLGFPRYDDDLADARARTESSESVVIARGHAGDHPLIVASFEFGFLGGSMGTAAGERICRAFDVAERTRTPLLALVASGGARMQEGMLALAQMPGTLVSRARLARAGVPFIAYLRNPTTGGVYASFASSADLLWAEPHAMIGFGGPRVVELVTGEPVPESSHTAESAESAGLLDELILPETLPTHLARALERVRATPPSGDGRAPEEPQGRGADAWRRVKAARAAERPTGADYLTDVVPIQRPAHDPTIVAGLDLIAGANVVVVAQNAHVNGGRPTPAGYRRARHAFALADRLGLPIVTLIDTPGADPSPRSERNGIARELSRTMQALMEVRVPTVAVVVGEGGSGGALALATCDRLLIQENAVFSVIAPEGAASILKREDVARMAAELRPTAQDLRSFGLADLVIAEERAASRDDVAGARATLEQAIAWALDQAMSEGAPTERRFARWRTWTAPR